MLHFRILGELEAIDGDRALSLGGAKQRAVLAILIVHRGEALTTDRLIDELWGERPPATAAKTLQVYISHVRKILGEGVVATRGGGYSLDVPADQVDAERFEQLAARGRDALRDADPDTASKALHEALELWRGPALADFAYEAFAQREAARLQEARLDALEDRIDADLARGEHASLCSELEALVGEHPTRERLQGQLMLALYRSGRQAEALERYATARRSLQEELGIEPGRALAELQHRILEQDPALDPPHKPPPLSRPGGLRRGPVLVIVGGLLLLGAGIGAIVTHGDDPGVELEPNSVAVIDPDSGEVEDGIAVGARPGEISAGEGAVWVANLDDESVSEIDPANRRVAGTAVPGGHIDGMAAGAGGVWVADVRRGLVSKIDPGFRRVTQRVRIGPGGGDDVDGPVAVGSNSVWIGNGDAAIARVDPEAGRRVATVNVGNYPVGLAVGGAAVWVADDADNTVTRISAGGAAAVTRTIPLGPGPSSVAVGEGAVWVAESQADEVVRIDPRTEAVTNTIPVGQRPTGIVAAEGGVWVANSVSGTLSRIDPESNDVDLTVDVGQSPQDVAVAGGRVWTTLAAGVEPPSPEADTDEAMMRVLTGLDLGDVDPATSFPSFQRAYATCAQLFNYPDAPAPAGSILEPEVAAGAPEVSDGGRTYTFTIRPGYAFSPPSNEPVTAASFERQIERVLRLHSYGRLVIQDIVGARSYAAHPERGLAGVSAHGDQLVIRLAKPSPDFLTRISTPWFCAVPADTPIAPARSTPVPTAGPYYYASYVPKRTLVLRRNPNYGGSRPAELAEIVYELGSEPESALAQVEAGEADYYSDAADYDFIPRADIDRLDRLYGAHSEAASAGAQRLFTTQLPDLHYLLFNTDRPLFDDARIRRAVNFAVDRRAMARESDPDATARPTDQLLPPGLPGYADAAIYPLGGPDVARARELAGPLDAHAVFYVCNLPTCLKLGEIVSRDLARIGIEVEVRSFPESELFHRINTPNEPFDLAWYGWLADYPDPYTFINVLFQKGVAFHAGILSDPVFDRRMAAAAKLTGDERLETYAKLDRDFMARAAPAVPYANSTPVSLFSERIGCQVNHPMYGIILGRLCVR
jgi:YVTN family beta-propeller protein